MTGIGPFDRNRNWRHSSKFLPTTEDADSKDQLKPGARSPADTLPRGRPSMTAASRCQSVSSSRFCGRSIKWTVTQSLAGCDPPLYFESHENNEAVGNSISRSVTRAAASTRCFCQRRLFSPFPDLPNK